MLERRMRKPMHQRAVQRRLFERRLREHVPDDGNVLASLLERSLRELVRRGHVHRRLLGGRLQHVVPKGRHVQHRLLERSLPHRMRRGLDVLGELFERRMHSAMRSRRDVLVHELQRGRLHVHGSGLSEMIRHRLRARARFARALSR